VFWKDAAYNVMEAEQVELLNSLAMINKQGLEKYNIWNADVIISLTFA